MDWTPREHTSGPQRSERKARGRSAVPTAPSPQRCPHSTVPAVPSPQCHPCSTVPAAPPPQRSESEARGRSAVPEAARQHRPCSTVFLCVILLPRCAEATIQYTRLTVTSCGRVNGPEAQEICCWEEYEAWQKSLRAPCTCLAPRLSMVRPARSHRKVTPSSSSDSWSHGLWGKVRRCISHCV